MNMKRVLLTTTAGIILAGGAVFTTVIVMEESSARADDIASQAQQFATLTERDAALTTENAALTTENAALSERLDLCLATTATYKGYAVEQQGMLRGIQDKWGKNYMLPVEDAFSMLQAASDQMECY